MLPRPRGRRRDLAREALRERLGVAVRLAIVTPRIVEGDGQGRVNLEIARQALERGWSLLLVAREVAPELRERTDVTWIPVRVRNWPTELVRDQVFALRSWRALRRPRNAVDVAIANGFVSWAAADVNVAHFVHGAWLRSEHRESDERRSLRGAYQWLYSALNARLERRAFGAAERVVAVSGAVAEQLAEIGVGRERIETIPNGVDLRRFTPRRGESREAREAAGLPGGVPLALFVGEIRTRRKGLDIVLRALREAPGVHLAVVGDAAGADPYRRLAAELGVTGRVRFLGYRKDVDAVMRACDLLVAPSRYDPFSLVVVEAMACGLPVITARSVGASDLVDPAAGVVLEEPDDAPRLAAALRRILADPARTRAMGVRARSAAERHGWDGMARAYLDLCLRVTAAKRGGRRDAAR